MLRFVFVPPSGSGSAAELRGLHLLGNDGVPVRGEVEIGKRELRCVTRSQDPLALSLLWPAGDFGAVQLETTRLSHREQPYLLNLELARHRLMRISLKREEWGLFDFHGMEEIAGQIDEARALFVRALQQISNTAEAARSADEALRLSLWASEALCRFHADIFLSRRQQNGGFARPFLGAAVDHGATPETLPAGLRSVLDFVRVPFVWRQIQPKEQGLQFDFVDRWIKLSQSAGLAVRGGPLLNFGIRAVPDWMYIWENDFDSIRDYAQEYVRRCVQRYKDSIQHWIVASGFHADNVFSFSFEQIMEITRVAVSTVRQLAPRTQIVLDLTQPWGEYFARNPRSVPPLLYADMAAQSGISFDAFGLQFLFGIGSDGYHLRDHLQISSLIDKLANLGKPLHITAVAVPAGDGKPADAATLGGTWHQDWSEDVQAEWLQIFAEIALSKPYVESFCLDLLADDRNAPVPTGGLLRQDFTPKGPYHRLKALRERLTGTGTG